MASDNRLFTIFGFALFAAADTWLYAMLYTSLAAFESMRSAVLAVIVGMVSSVSLTAFLPPPGYVLSALLTGALALAMAPICYRYSRGATDAIAQTPGTVELETFNPESFLRPTHALFSCILLFNIAAGYGLTLNMGAYSPSITYVAVGGIAIVATWLLLCQKRTREDTLFSIAFLFVLAGILVSPYPLFARIGLPNALILVGNFCFSVLTTLVVVAVGRRNVFALLPVFGLVHFVEFIGVDIGAVVGHASTGALGARGQEMGAPSAWMGFFFVAFLWLGFRRFSFADTIEGVMSVEIAHDESRPIVSLDARCEELSDSFGLTKRERDMLKLLAHGKDARYLTEHYTVSYNTVKTHIKHIYLKLGVHSQVELIRLVDGRG
ncbi:MAG: helix-turn-helix transcriptional regulator [Bifidobacteriaceae bacterium]|nr:helix-turn-helix transcriptional regulator [Bifidobacteriaceae bacterium]